ncbi:hypothetical protein BDP27DRAFT_1417513 [Rhodocollybia butyracea]|uniref:Aminoglycoside phosphotransferase domain-containing protein n=1 Tax=Rhodocollybia butyracea TaxID=206335 RepID=A0A9P5UBG0_9AGAR|nr:hypothetical protein BDP27DRAFT_1417513 [Rhodocollybia butyracea]
MAQILDRLLGLDDLTRKNTAVLKPSPSDAWSNAEIIERMKTAPELPDSMVNVGNPEALPWGDVYILCSDTVVKRCAEVSAPAPEATVLSFVHQHTSIPVPRVRRYVPNKWYGYLLMEKIPGKRLDTLWPSYSPLQKFLAAWTLRGYVRQLRQASAAYNRRHIPGPMSKKLEKSFWHFSTSKMTKKRSDYSQPSTPLDDSQPLVLTHGHIRLRNVIVGDDGKLWLTGWPWAAFYPPYFEYIATMSAADADEADHSWIKHIPIVTNGAYRKELEYIVGV